MNKVVEVAVELNCHLIRRPLVHVWFDKLDTDALSFSERGSTTSDEFYNNVLLTPMPMCAGKMLLAIDEDLAQWYYQSDANPVGSVDATLIVDGVRRSYQGLWLSCAQAANLWFPEIMVMEVMINGKPGGAVAASVVARLKEQGYQVGLVAGADGYTSVEPLDQQGNPLTLRSRIVTYL